MIGKKQAHVSRTGVKRRAARWPCIVCEKQCVTDAIFCEHCCEWAPYACENIGEGEFKELSNVSCQYVCSKCCADQKGGFDFKKSLKRLSDASTTIVALHKAAIVEKILLKNHPFSVSAEEPALTTNRTIHQYSQSVANVCGRIPSRVPIHVSGDGNCLFNAVSVAIQGNEELSCELRVRTCLELVLNFEHYKAHANYQNFRLVSPDLVKACQKCARDGNFSSVFTIQGLSHSVIGREIVSVYPAMNGMLDSCMRILNTVITPRVSLSRNTSRGRVYVLWTRMCGTCPQPRDQIWLPNHFVPLIEECHSTSDANTSSPVSVTSPSPKIVASPLDTTTTPSNDDSTEQQPTAADNNPNPNTSPLNAHNDTKIDLSDMETDNCMPREDCQGENLEVDAWSECSMSEFPEEVPDKSSERFPNDHSNNKLNGRFLDVESLCGLLQNENDVKSSIPKGLKEDVYFLIENEGNSQKRVRGKRSNFEDDCGAWFSKSSSTKKTLFHHFNNTFKTIEVKNGKYCTMKMKEWVPLEPQPRDEEVVIMRRFYATLKRKTDYKK